MLNWCLRWYDQFASDCRPRPCRQTAVRQLRRHFCLAILDAFSRLFPPPIYQRAACNTVYLTTLTGADWCFKSDVYPIHLCQAKPKPGRPRANCFKSQTPEPVLPRTKQGRRAFKAAMLSSEAPTDGDGKLLRLPVSPSPRLPVSPSPRRTTRLPVSHSMGAWHVRTSPAQLGWLRFVLAARVHGKLAAAGDAKYKMMRRDRHA